MYLNFIEGPNTVSARRMRVVQNHRRKPAFRHHSRVEEIGYVTAFFVEVLKTKKNKEVSTLI